MWPRIDSRTWHQMWVEFVVGSRPCYRGFSSGTLDWFSPRLSPKSNIYNFQFDLNTVDEQPPCGCATANSQFIYLFIFMYYYESVEDNTKNRGGGNNKREGGQATAIEGPSMQGGKVSK